MCRRTIEDPGREEFLCNLARTYDVDFDYVYELAEEYGDDETRSILMERWRS